MTGWITLWACHATALAGTPRAPLAAEPIQAHDLDVALVVKWNDALRARVDRAGRIQFSDSVDRGALDTILDQWGARVEPLIKLPARTLAQLEHRAEVRSGRDQPDLAGMHRILILDPTPERLTELGQALLGLPGVEFVTTEADRVPPPADIAPTTPDHSGSQGYLGPDPGIDAEYAWTTWGLSGAGVRVSDCEYGWDGDHEDLVDGGIIFESGQTSPSWVVENGWHHHGTAVAGEIFGQDNGYGVTGIASGAEFAVFPEWSNEEGGRRVTSITNAIAQSDPGDIVVLEMQAFGPDGSYAPAEVDLSVWTVVRSGVDAGVVVIGAAGNGAADLDGTDYADYMARGDSGAILVGAGTNNTDHDRLSFSTYGTRVDVQGWGTGVFTTGYGSFAEYGGDTHQAYISGFNGTSSATPIVSGAATLLVEASLRYRETPITPDDLRDLLVQTGIPAGTGVIGPLPDLEAALTQLELDLDILPSVQSVAAPKTVAEGAVATVTATVEVLPVHLPRVVWTTVDGTELGTGPTIDLPAVDDGPLEVDVTVLDEWDRTATERVIVTVTNVPPVGAAIVATGEPLEGSEIALSTAATDAGIEDTHTFEWSVDGEALPEGTSTVSHVFPDDGTFVVEVIAVDDDGGRAESVSLEIEVEDVVPTVSIELTEDPRRNREVGLSATIVDPGTADTHAVAWDFGDGSTGTGVEVTHAWEDVGTFEVTATVTDDDGVAVVASETIEVSRAGGCGCASTGPAAAGWIGLIGLLGLRRSRRS